MKLLLSYANLSSTASFQNLLAILGGTHFQIAAPFFTRGHERGGSNVSITDEAPFFTRGHERGGSNVSITDK